MDIVAKGIQLLKKVGKGHGILSHVQVTVGNIVGQVVYGIDKGNLGRKTFYSDILTINDENATETFGITECCGKKRIVWYLIEF